MIDLKEAITILESGNWCSIDYVSYDAKKKRYGEIIRIPKCRLMTKATSGKTIVAKVNQSSENTNPKHSEHFTKNVITPSGSVRKLHLRLLFQINNQRIL